MKAEDTLITYDKDIIYSLRVLMEKVLLEQAEKSFNAGIKEVVEWVLVHLVHVGGQNCILELRTSEEWQAKLKSWQNI